MKNKFLGSLLVSTLVLTTFGSSVLAAQVTRGEEVVAVEEVDEEEGTEEEPAPIKTHSDVTFEQGETPTEPGGPTDPTDPIKPTDPIETKPTIDGVTLLHAPSFKFGKVKVNPLGDTYPVLESKFTSVKHPEAFYDADFVQVVDVSGKDSLTWELTVQQDGIFASGEHKLNNTSIRLLDQSIFNSNGEDVNGLEGFVIPEETMYTAIPTDTPLSVLSSTEAGATNNSYTTNIFKGNYVYKEEKNTVQGNNEDVLLSVPAGEKPQADEQYSTTLTWTLSVNP